MLRPGCIVLIGFIFSSFLVQAQNTGIYEAGITMNGVRYTEPLNSLQNKTIVVSGPKLFLTSVFLKTFRNSSFSNICKGYFFYRLYPENNAPSSFNQIDCSISSDINGGQGGFQNQLWQNNSINTNLAKNLDTGNYVLEVYYGAEAADDPSCNDVPTIYLKNGPNPFKAIISITPPLNIVFTGFTTRSDNENVFLEWEIQQPVSQLQYFILEKSHNGVAWSILDTVQNNGTEYFYTDKSPYEGVNFYRVRASGSGKINYSIVRRIYVGFVENIITIYPNPVYRNLRFQMTAILKGRYDAVVYNTDGARIAYRIIEHDGNDNFITMPLPENMSKGVFWLVLYGRNEFFKRSFLIE